MTEMQPSRLATLGAAVVGLCISLLLMTQSSHAQSGQAYPTKPVRFVVAYPPGGPTDILARLLSPKLQAALGQPFIVESRPGAGGNVGTDFVAKSPADGYTILLTASGPISINVTLYKSLPYDPARDLTPVIHVASVPLVLVVHPSVPAKTVSELIALLKAKPEGYSFASAGNGTPQHLSAELFKTMADVKMLHVPYKGSAPAINDLVGGQVPVAFESMVSVLPQVKGGRLRALATTGNRRSGLLPDVPTVAEAGLPGYESIAWYGVMAPGGTPKPIVDKLNAEISKALDTPELKQRVADLGSDSVHGTPEQFGAFIKSETSRWGKVVKESGATVD
jgi:tripartite-type tricarboxylate transporter receptor subunit TctC